MAVLLIAEVTDGALNVDATAKACLRPIAGRCDDPCAGCSAEARLTARQARRRPRFCWLKMHRLGHRLAEPTADSDRVAGGRLRPYRCTCDDRRQERHAPCGRDARRDGDL